MLLCRRAVPEDVEMFRAVRLKALQDSPDAFGSTYEAAIERDLDSWRKQLLSTVAGDLSNTQFVLDGDDCVGLGALYRQPEATSGDIIMMWVSPDHRSSGAGSMIVSNLVSWAQGIGLKGVKLTVTDTNVRGIKFYERCGFSLTGEKEDVDLSRGLRGVRMSKVLI